MGLGNYDGARTYVNITQGKLATGNKDNRKTFTDLTGHLTDVNIVEDTYDNKTFKVLELTIVDGKDTFILKMRFESGYARAFCCTIENADLTSQIRFSPSFKEENGKKQYNFFMVQHGKGLKWKYTKASPGDLPGLSKVTFKGEDHWDNTEQMRYFTDLLINKIKPACQHALFAGPASEAKAGAGAPAAGGLGKTPTNPDDVHEPIDDLPF